jgi:hypothetical protein
MGDYYDTFGKTQGTLEEHKNKPYFHNKNLGDIEINLGDKVDLLIDGEWITHQFNGKWFVNEKNEMVDFIIGQKAAYHRIIDLYMQQCLSQLLHPDSFRTLIGKLYSIQKLTLFDCILFKESCESGDSFIKGTQFFFFENWNTYCSVHHFYKREEDAGIAGGYSYVYDRFEFMTIEGEHFTETYVKRYEKDTEERVNNDDYEEEYNEYLREKGLID